MNTKNEIDVLHFAADFFADLPPKRAEIVFGQIASRLLIDSSHSNGDFTMTEVESESGEISYDIRVYRNNPGVRLHITHSIAEVYTQNHELADLDK